MSNAEYCARRRVQRLAEGQCAQCGVADHEPGRTRCAKCLVMCQENSAARRKLANRMGKCQACLTRKQAPGRGRRCKRCADRYAEALRVRRAA